MLGIESIEGPSNPGAQKREPFGVFGHDVQVPQGAGAQAERADANQVQSGCADSEPRRAPSNASPGKDGAFMV